MTSFSMGAHNVKAEDVTVTANKTPRETWWISIEVEPNSAITIFARTAYDFEQIIQKIKDGLETVTVIP